MNSISSTNFVIVWVKPHNNNHTKNIPLHHISHLTDFCERCSFRKASIVEVSTMPFAVGPH